MTTVGAYEAKTHLPRLLEQVEQGETVTITRHGRAVARLVPIGHSAADVAEAVADLRRLRDVTSRGELAVREMVEDGRR